MGRASIGVKTLIINLDKEEEVSRRGLKDFRLLKGREEDFLEILHHLFVFNPINSENPQVRFKLDQIK